MKTFLILLVVATAFSFGYLSGAKTIYSKHMSAISYLDAENANLQFQLQRCITLYRGQ